MLVKLKVETLSNSFIIIAPKRAILIQNIFFIIRLLSSSFLLKQQFIYFNARRLQRCVKKRTRRIIIFKLFLSSLSARKYNEQKTKFY